MHVFDRRADETIGWIQEKDAALSGQGYGQDLETIQALVRQHQVFETDLAAVKEQVCRSQHTAATYSSPGSTLNVSLKLTQYLCVQAAAWCRWTKDGGNEPTNFPGFHRCRRNKQSSLYSVQI